MLVSGCKIDRSELLRYLGYTGQEIDAKMHSRIEEISNRCMRVSKPACTYGLFSIKEAGEGVLVSDNSVVFRGKDITAHLRGAQKCAVMAATLGMESEREMRAIEYKSVTDAVIFSAACTALVESAADICEEEIRSAAAASGHYVNSRYSPGYGDFPIEAQKILLKLIDAERRLGLTLTEGLMMIPRKSVSAVLGIFPHPMEKNQKGCDGCSMRNTCIMRKRGESCGR